MPAFKYATYIARVAECPPTSATEGTRRAYRFVFNPVDAESFKPTAISVPKRFEKKPCCTDCAVSLYESEEDARDAFAELLENHSKIREKVGDSLGMFNVLPEHGPHTAPDHTGHFDLFEYVNVDLAAVTSVVGTL